MPLDLVDTLSELVSRPSVNPMGEPLTGPEYFEGRVTDYLEQLFRGLKLPYERQTVQPGARQHTGPRRRRHAALPGRAAALVRGPSGHRAGHRHDDRALEAGGPRRPAVRPRLVRRQGGLTAMLGAVVRLAEERPPGRPTVVLACTVGEEFGHVGADALRNFGPADRHSSCAARIWR